jgi:hypothetical protein
LRCGIEERAPCEHGRPVVQWMSDRCGWLDQVEVKLERAKERGGHEQRMDRGADVVAESGKRQLRCARTAADRLVRLDDADGAPGLSQRDRSGKAVRPRPDDDRVKCPYRQYVSASQHYRQGH